MSGGCGSAAQHRVVPGHADPGGPAGACAQGGRSSTKNTKITKVPVLHFIYIYILLFFIFFFLQFCWSGSILTDCIFWMENLRRSHRRRFLGEGRAEEPQDDTAPMRPKTLDEAGLHNIFWRFQSCM